MFYNFLINLNNMKYLKFVVFLLICALFVNGYAQKTPAKSINAQQKVVRLTPAKTDTNDPNKKALNQFSKEQMFTPAPASSKPLTPDETRAKGFFNEGSKKGKAGDYNGAIVEFTKSLNLVKNPVTYVKRGYAYQMAGNFSAAIQDATEALKLQPTLSLANFVRGVSQYGKGEFKEAKADLDIYLKTNRNNAIAFNYMAALSYMSQDYKAALTNYDEVVKLDPKYPDIYTNRGMMRHILQDYKGAMQDCNDALKLNPKNATAYNNRGGAYAMLKDYQAALDDFDKAINIDNKYADAYNSRGRVKQVLGDMDGACADWQSAYTNGLEDSKELIVKYCK